MDDKIQLRLENIKLNFGGVIALSDVSFDVKEKEVLAIIGPNGAGKTSLINCITGFYRPQQGNIFFNGQNITKLHTDQMVKVGIARTFQHIQLYTGMTVMENLLAARHNHIKYGLLSAMIHFPRAHKEEVTQWGEVQDIIDLLEMQSIRKRTVGTLSYGQRKRVDLGRALAQEPKLLLLDEPMAGMSVDEKEDLCRFILATHDLKGISIVLIEHDMGVVMDIADRIVVLDFGEKIAEGTPKEIKVNPRVIKAYLG